MRAHAGGVYGAAIGIAVLLAAGASLTAVQPEPPTPRLSDLLSRAASYLDDFVGRFSNVVSEERYLQEVFTGVRGSTMARQRRDLRSDFLLVKPPDSLQWLPFRDVYEVDGAPVRDREQRLARLFLESSGTAVEQAAQIADESARYNIGNIRRTVNNPVLALAFLGAGTQARFRYEIDRRDGDAGASVWVVEYHEQSRPTLIKGAYDRDLPAEGRCSIDARTGRVLRTELTLADPSVMARVTTRFEFDGRLGIAVPVQMEETYRLTSSGAQVTGRATYGRFRRFDVTATETIDVRQ